MSKRFLDKLRAFGKLEDEIHEELEEILHEYIETFKEADPKKYKELIKSKDFVSANSVGFLNDTSEAIEFSGKEYWGYGGEEEHRVYLPIEFIKNRKKK